MKEKLNWILIIILSSILAIVLNFSCFKTLNLFVLLSSFFFFLLIFYFIWPKLFKFKLKKINNPNNKIKKYEYIIFILIIFIPLVCMLFIYYPGISFPDTSNQWQQIQTGLYNNWHPIIETLFMFKIPSIFCNDILSVSIFQLLLIFLIELYFAIFLRKNFLNFKWTILVLCILVLNPLNLKYDVYLLKDTIYSWCIFLATLCTIQIVITNGDWINKIYNKILLILSIIGIICFRHNGIVPGIFVLILLIICYPKFRKFYSISLITILISFLFVTKVGYGMLGFNKNTGGLTEMMGIPFGQVSYYYNNYAYFNKDELELIENLAPLEIWREYYNPRNFNIIKWNPNFKDAWKYQYDILKLWIDKSFKNPKMFIRSYLDMTSPIWQINDFEYLKMDEINISNEKIIGTKFNISLPENLLKNFAIYYNTCFNFPLRLVFNDYGQGLYIIILAFCIVIRKSKLKIERYIPFIPVLINTLVIMCLITGEETRFVYSQIITYLPLLIYAFACEPIKKLKN